MKFLYKIPIIFLVSFLVINCSVPASVVPVARVIEKERVVNKPFDAVWQSTVEWFATHNTPIKNLDKSSGLVSTEYSLSMDEAANYMDCGGSTSAAFKPVEKVNHSGNFNVLLKRIDDNNTKISINVFFGCTVNQYQENLLGNRWLISSSNIKCTTKGLLEKQVLDFLEANN